MQFIFCFVILCRETSDTKCSEKSNVPGKCKRKGALTVVDVRNNATGAWKKNSGSFNEEERFDPSKPYHPGPLKLEIKSIRNSTRTDATDIDINSLVAGDESGRSLITAAVLVSWIFLWKWKAYLSFFIVHSIDFIWTSVKNLLGWGNEHYETTITLGHDDKHPHDDKKYGLYHYVPDGHGHDPHHGHHHHQPQHGHHHHQPHHGWGNHNRWVYKTKHPWHHPATKLFDQPTVQYLPDGKEYTLLGFDQHQAYKYRRKYDRKFARYRKKYHRKKKKQIIKAQRQRDRDKKKAARRQKKAERRKEKWERFKDRVKEVQDFYQSINGNKQESEEAHDDLKDGEKKQHEQSGDKKEATFSVKTVPAKITKPETEKKKGDDDDSKVGDTLEEKDKTDDDDLNIGSTKEEDHDDIGEEEEESEDLPYDDKSWEESSSEIEHGKPPRQSYTPHYKQGHDYDPLPTKSKNQKFIRIRI